MGINNRNKKGKHVCTLGVSKNRGVSPNRKFSSENYDYPSNVWGKNFWRNPHHYT